MNKKLIMKISIDIAMTFVLLFLMAYELVGQTAHEWLGTAMFVLFVLHHVLNRKWTGNIFKGKYTVARFVQTLLVVLILVSMIGSMYSGIVLSRHVFSFLPIKGGHSLARNIHMLSAYWGFVLMSLHLGFHWSMMLGMAKKARAGKDTSAVRRWIGRILAFLIAGYGVSCFINRQVGSYMLLKIQFAFFDFSEPIVKFMLDYMAVMGLFVFIGHYFMRGLRKIKL